MGSLGAAAPKRPFRPFWAVPKGPRARRRETPPAGTAEKMGSRENMKLAENLLQFREKSGLSQKQVAEKVGVVVRAYQRYEYGDRYPQLPTLIALADLFDVSLDDLVGRTR